MYGKILNIYLNYDMIFNVLSKNVDKKGNLTFFKFLQSICDNINSSFANVVDIEPIIKNDKTITFMDATKTWPHEDGVFDAVLSEHMIEHISDEDGTRFLQEAFRFYKLVWQ